VIVGAGFGGLMAARGLARAPVDVLLIDRHNYHLFQLLLYQVATAALSPADIAEPIRAVLRRQPNATVLLDEVIGVDPAAQIVKTRTGTRQHYDWLILATGSKYHYFGHADWPSRAYVGELISCRARGNPVPPPFRYRNEGVLATIGRRSAIADFGWVRLTGFVAWVIWGIVHIFFLIGFRDRASVFLNWAWAWVTYGRGARLITGEVTPLSAVRRSEEKQKA